VIYYDPFAFDWRRRRNEIPQTYWWQGLTMGRLEAVLDLLTVQSPGNPAERVISFGEFEQFYEQVLQNGQERDRKTLAVAANALNGFRPSQRPVFCRMLLVQARLYQALLRTRAEGFRMPSNEDDWKMLLQLDDPQEFEWKGEHSDAVSIAVSLDATDEYLRRFLYGPRLAQHV